jgi:hypothetical protein
MLWLSFNVRTYQAKITTPGLVFHPETTKYASFNTNVKIGVIGDCILYVISTALIAMVLKTLTVIRGRCDVFIISKHSENVLIAGQIRQIEKPVFFYCECQHQYPNTLLHVYFGLY